MLHENKNETIATFWEHVEEFRLVLIKIFIVLAIGFSFSLLFYRTLFDFLILPLQIIAPTSPLLILSPLSGFIIVFKICFYLSLILTSPITLYFAFQFISPALRRNERKAALPFLSSSLIGIFLGISAAYFVTLPLASEYLFQFNATLGENRWTLTEYIDFVLTLFAGHAITAELGVVLFFLVHLKILSAEWLISKRRYTIVLAFVLGAVFTPPDIPSQALMAVPLICLYEAMILYARLISLRERKLNHSYHSHLE